MGERDKDVLRINFDRKLKAALKGGKTFIELLNRKCQLKEI
jgi:hypothetical protein